MAQLAQNSQSSTNRDYGREIKVGKKEEDSDSKKRNETLTSDIPRPDYL